jgi:hypothetical protein
MWRSNILRSIEVPRVFRTRFTGAQNEPERVLVILKYACRRFYVNPDKMFVQVFLELGAGWRLGDVETSR